jgi:hypothetical protein
MLVIPTTLMSLHQGIVKIHAAQGTSLHVVHTNKHRPRTEGLVTGSEENVLTGRTREMATPRYF